jgi:hypothetical protein
MSWPLMRDPARYGIADRADGQLSVWLVAWDAHVLATGPGRLFDAPIFHPATQALAFSENMLLPALLAAPATLLGGPVLGYNLCSCSARWCRASGAIAVRRVSGDRCASVVAGLLYAAGAQRWTRIVHLHEQFTPFLPLALLALERFWERRTLRRALLVGLALALQAMASIYLGVILATLLGLLMALALVSGLRVRRGRAARARAGLHGRAGAAARDPLPADARALRRRVVSRGGRAACADAAVLSRERNAALRRAHGTASGSRRAATAAVPGRRAAGARDRGAGARAAPFPRGGGRLHRPPRCCCRSGRRALCIASCTSTSCCSAACAACSASA